MSTIWGRVENIKTIWAAVWCSKRILPWDLGGRLCPWFCQWCAEWCWVAYLTSLRLGFPTFKTRIWIDQYLLALIFCVCTVINKPVYDPFLCDCQLFWIHWVGYRWSVEKQGASCPLPLALSQQWLFFDPCCPFTPTCPRPPQILSVHSLSPLVDSFVASVVTSVWTVDIPVFPALPEEPGVEPLLCFYLNCHRDCRQWVLTVALCTHYPISPRSTSAR